VVNLWAILLDSLGEHLDNREEWDFQYKQEESEGSSDELLSR
jgi:hypothetical protein